MRFNYLITVPLLSAFSIASAGAQDAPLPPGSEIAARMVSHDAQRQVSLAGYAGMRRYVLVNEHMHKRAEMVRSESTRLNSSHKTVSRMPSSA